ncbi:hypothetical protein QJS04_geneDACA024915 [Acorus gramineus]|uniref:DDE Tnp4 domain-containing protein n=1 Tax=Acorus gramineus TaxID=55184 RepID=A0AAV9A0F7_ACOGR|nr:hypothetical protein QJS04_geneDACA024915 [Acorus gramineus]
MDQHVFRRLADLFRREGWLEDTRNMWIEEQLAIFLTIVGHNSTNRYCQDRFQHSGETISRQFREVLSACLKLSKLVIHPPDDCVGAIDGTLVHAIIETESQVPFRGRKGDCMQNVLAICSFDMQFTYAEAGWEGTAHDSRILSECIRDPSRNFPMPPPGKYYVADAGYSNNRGFLTPFRNVRYWLGDYRGRSGPQNKEELFNFYHSSLRNVIERTFGVWKARFPILKKMASYSFDIQVRIVIATMAIHNYIRRENQADTLFREFENTNTDEDRSAETLYAPIQPERDQIEMNRTRDQIADLLMARR